MDEKDIERSISKYLNVGFEDTDYIAKIVNSLPFSELSDVICRLLVSDDEDTASMTQLFLRDAILIGNRNEACHSFRADYPESKIVKKLEELVFDDRYLTRRDAIYTIGKTCSYSSRDVLIRAFEQFQDSDPLIVSRLVGEMQWLGVENMQKYIERMANSSSYLTRWAATEHIHTIENEFPDWVETLRKDDSDLVRLEAEYNYQRILKSIQTPILSKIEQRQRAKEIKKIEPKTTFFGIGIGFYNHKLAKYGMTNYTVADLLCYID